MAKRLNYVVGFTGDTKQLQEAINQVTASLDKLGSKGFKNTSTELKEASQAALDLSSHLKTAFNQKTGKLDLITFNNSLKKSGQTLEGYAKNLQQLGPEGERAFLQVAQSIASADLPLRRSNELMSQLWTTMQNAARWQLSSSVIHGFMGAIQTAYGYSKDLNESLNNIRIVTGQNSEEMERFAEKANKAAKALSTTTNDYAQASLIYYQQGLADDQVEERTNATIKFANVSRETAETASEQLTAIWNNFADGSQSLEHYIDVLTALGATTASSSQEISAGIQKFAGIANTIGLSYEYAASALATITAETRESADVVGTALRTLFARLEGLSLGETLDDGTDLNKYSKALAAVGVQIKDTNGDLKDMDTLLDELGARWSTLARDEQVALAQTVAGVRQYSQLMVLMDSWQGAFQENLATARGSDGSLQEQFDIYAESWEAARDRVRAASEDIYNSLINPQAFIDLDNIVTPLLSGIADIIDALGGMKGAAILVGSAFTSIYSEQMAQGLRDMLTNTGLLFGIEQQRTRETQAQVAELAKALKINGDGSQYVEIQLKAIQQNVKLRAIMNEKAEQYTAAEKEALAVAQEQLGVLEKATEAEAKRIAQMKTQQEDYRELAESYNLLSTLSRQQRKAAVETFNEVMGYAKGQGAVATNESQEKFYSETLTFLEEAGAEVGRLHAFRDELSKLGETTEFSAEKFDELAKSFGYAIKDFGDIGTITTVKDALKGTEQELLQRQNEVDKYVKALKALGATAEAADGVEKFSKNNIALSKATIENVRQLENFNGATERTIDLARKAGTATKDWADKAVAAANALSRVAMAVQAVQNLGKVWGDDNLSDSEKILQILTSLTMILPTIISGLKGLYSTYKTTVEASKMLKSSVSIMDAAETGVLSLTNATELLTKAQFNFINLGLGAAVAAIGAVVMWLDSMAKASERAREKVSDLTKAYQEETKKTEELGSQIESNSQRIKEIQGLEAPTLVETEELKKLQAQNILLERQLELQKEIEKASREQQISGIAENWTTMANDIKAPTFRSFVGQDASYAPVLGMDPQAAAMAFTRQRVEVEGLRESFAGWTVEVEGVRGSLQEYIDTYNNFNSAEEWLAHIHDELGVQGEDFETLKKAAEDYEAAYNEFLTENKDKLVEYQRAYTEYVQYLQDGGLANPAINLDEWKASLKSLYEQIYRGKYNEIVISPVLKQSEFDGFYRQVQQGTKALSIAQQELLDRLGVSADDLFKYVEDGVTRVQQGISNLINKEVTDPQAAQKIVDDLLSSLGDEDYELLLTLDFENIETFDELYRRVIELKDQTIIFDIRAAKDAGFEALQALAEGKGLDSEIIDHLTSSFGDLLSSEFEALSMYDQLVEVVQALRQADSEYAKSIDKQRTSLENQLRVAKEYDKTQKDNIKNSEKYTDLIKKEGAARSWLKKSLEEEEEARNELIAAEKSYERQMSNTSALIPSHASVEAAQKQLKEAEGIVDNMQQAMIKARSEISKYVKDTNAEIESNSIVATLQEQLDELNSKELGPIILDVEIDTAAIEGLAEVFRQAASYINDDFTVSLNNVNKLAQIMPELFEQATFEAENNIVRLGEAGVKAAQDHALERLGIVVDEAQQELLARIETAKGSIAAMRSAYSKIKDASDQNVIDLVNNDKLTAEEIKATAKGVLLTKLQNYLDEQTGQNNTEANAISSENHIAQAAEEQGSRAGTAWAQAWAAAANAAIDYAQTAVQAQNAVNNDGAGMPGRVVAGTYKTSSGSDSSITHQQVSGSQAGDDLVRKYLETGGNLSETGFDEGQVNLLLQRVREITGNDSWTTGMLAKLDDAAKPILANLKDVGGTLDSSEDVLKDISEAIQAQDEDLADAFAALSNLQQLDLLNAINDGKGSGKSGKSGGSGKEEERETKTFESDIDAYHEINDAIEQQNRLLEENQELLDKAQENKTEDRYALWAERIRLLNQEYELYNDKLDIANNVLNNQLETYKQLQQNELGLNLSDLIIDADGYISNYIEVLQEAEQAYVDAMEAYNAGAQEKEDKERVALAEKWLKTVKDLISSIEGTEDIIRGIDESLKDTNDTIDNMYDSIRKLLEVTDRFADFTAKITAVDRQLAAVERELKRLGDDDSSDATLRKLELYQKKADIASEAARQAQEDAIKAQQDLVAMTTDLGLPRPLIEEDQLLNSIEIREKAIAGFDMLHAQAEQLRALGHEKLAENLDKEAAKYGEIVQLIDAIGESAENVYKWLDKSYDAEDDIYNLLKSLDIEVEKFKEDFHEINKLIEAQRRLLSNNEKIMDRMYGSSKISAFRKQTELLNKNLELQQRKLTEANSAYERELGLLNQATANAGVQDVVIQEGVLLNYTAIELELDEKIAEVRAQLATATGAQAVALGETLKSLAEAKKTITDLMDSMENILSTIMDTQDAITDTLQEIQDMALKEITYKMDVVLDIKNAKDLVREFKKAIEESYGDALTHGVPVAQVGAQQARADMEMYSSYLEEYNSLRGLMANADENTNLDGIADALKDLEQNIVSSGEALLAWLEEWEQMIPDAVDAARQRFQQFLDQLEHNRTIASTVQELYQLQGQTYKTLEGFNRLQAATKEQLDASVASARLNKAWMEEAQAKLAKAQAALEATAETDVSYDMLKNARDAYLQEFNKAQEAYLTSAKDAMESAREMYQRSIERAIYTFDQTASRGMGLDFMQTKFDHYIEAESRYLDKVNEAYETVSWYNKLQADIDKTNNAQTRERLKALQEEIDLRRENNTLSEYDLKVLDAKYKVMQAQIALEESQNNKTQLRMVRDSQGNWNFQYTADEDDMAQKQQDLLDAENEWYNLTKETAINTRKEILQAYIDFRDQVRAIAEDELLTEEEKQARYAELQTYFRDRVEYLGQVAEEVSGDVQQAAAYAMLSTDEMAEKLGINIEDLTGDIDNLKKLIEESNLSVQDLLTTDIETFKEQIRSQMSAVGQIVSSNRDKIIENLKKLGYEGAEALTDEDLVPIYDKLATIGINLAETLDDDIVAAYREAMIASGNDTIEQLKTLTSTGLYGIIEQYGDEKLQDFVDQHINTHLRAKFSALGLGDLTEEQMLAVADQLRDEKQYLSGATEESLSAIKAKFDAMGVDIEDLIFGENGSVSKFVEALKGMGEDLDYVASDPMQEFIDQILSNKDGLDDLDASGQTWLDTLEELTPVAADFGDISTQALEDIDQASKDLDKDIQDIAKKTGTSLDELDRLLRTVSDSTDRLYEKGRNAIDMLWRQIDAVDTLAYSYMDLAGEIETAVGQLYDLADAAAEALVELSALNVERGSSPSLPSTSGGSSAPAPTATRATYDPNTDYSLVYWNAMEEGDQAAADEALRFRTEKQIDMGITGVMSNDQLVAFRAAYDAGNEVVVERARGIIEGVTNDSGTHWNNYFDTETLEELRRQGVSLATGGYTGAWGPEGRAAILHEKELVLNEVDTSNLLDAIGIVRQITAALDSQGIMGMAGLASGLGLSAISASSGTLEQSVHIEATFPNVVDSNEIEIALLNLTNDAAQHARVRKS